MSDDSSMGNQVDHQTMRQEILTWLRHNPAISVLIIGAGVNGIGVFRDLALQGIDVLLVDRSDFCSGASAASSHMAHGGIRYLENGEFRLVREAVKERNLLLKNAPHYVKPLPTTIPIFKFFSGVLNAPLKFLGLLDRPAERGLLVIKIGLLLYDAYTRVHQVMPTHKLRNRSDSLKLFPELSSRIRYTATYFDGAILSPERLCIDLIQDAREASPLARAINYLSVSGVTPEGVILEDVLTGETFTVQPRSVVNAAGPWIDRVNQTMGQPTHLIGGTKGSHLVLDHSQLRKAIGDHELFFENDDGRIVLLFPLADRVLVGTTDIPIDDPDQAACTDDEVDYLIMLVRKVFPDIEVNRSHIVFQFTGVRPLPTSDTGHPGQISRDHSIVIHEAGNSTQFPVLSLVGGKWTTFRAFSEQVTDLILDRLGRSRQISTELLEIGGGKDYPRSNSDRNTWIAGVASQTGLDTDLVVRLLNRYGTRAREIAAFIARNQEQLKSLRHSPEFLQGEVEYILLNEHVVHLDDLLLRRSLMAMSGQVSVWLVREIARIARKTLGWIEEQEHEEIERVLLIWEQQHQITLNEATGNRVSD